MNLISRTLTLLCAAGILLSHGLTENENMWSRRTLKDVELIAGADPFIQFSLVDVGGKYFRIYMAQTKMFNPLLAGLLSAKASGDLVTVTSSVKSSSGIIISILDACTDCQIIIH